jgi:hypothetical protein
MAVRENEREREGRESHLTLDAGSRKEPAGQLQGNLCVSVSHLPWLPCQLKSLAVAPLPAQDSLGKKAEPRSWGLVDFISSGQRSE